MEANEPVEVEVMDMEVELQIFDAVSASVDAAMERCANIVLCYDTPKDVKSSRSWIYQNLNKLNPPIKKAGELGKAEALKFTRAMTAKEKELLGKVAKQIEDKYAPIKLIEETEALKKADEEAKKKAEEERIEAERLAEIEAAQKKLAEDQEELHLKQLEFNRKERDKIIAEDAAREAEQAARQAVVRAENTKNAVEEKARQDAIAAENAKIVAVQRVKDEAEAAAQERIAIAMEEQVAEKIETARIEDDKLKRKEEAEMAEADRINDEKHRSRIHKAIYLHILDTWHVGKVLATAITQSLIDENFPHTKIIY